MQGKNEIEFGFGPQTSPTFLFFKNGIALGRIADIPLSLKCAFCKILITRSHHSFFGLTYAFFTERITRLYVEK